ncbi:hypothetical protein L210DRAFT_2338149 [Boletus edulis BED1]|uniref:Uncharacterized protein n=1 Tax=Boletus edulis BED1 TaxID=1328754 RepID=A0AAD4BRD7_BOLED|nr:hypothetical protein L210DRAFT_2338149 [Boletus edulis BED1]
MAAPLVLYPPDGINDLFPQMVLLEPLRQPPAQPPFIMNANLREALWDLADVAPDLPAEEALRVEIERLSTATLIIDQAFCDIRRRLSDVSKEQNKSVGLYDTCQTLETQWRGHHTTYRNLIWRSREFAGDAQAVVDDFRELVLPALRDQNRTVAEKQEIIRGQFEVLQRISQPSQNLCQEFLDFGRALDTYIAEFSRAVEGLTIGEQSEKVDGLRERLHNARDAMEAVSRELRELGWKFAAEVAVTGIALLLAFVVPTCWATLVCGTVSEVTRPKQQLTCLHPQGFAIKFKDVARSGPRLFGAWRRFNLVATEYEAIKAEYELERACLNQMVKLESAFHDSRPLVQEVTTKLGLFASVWAAITADIRKLKISLECAEDAASPLFILRVQRLERMYGDFSQALRHYQVTVRLQRR